MGRIILVTGGARSGKSGFAEQLAQAYGERVGYIATAQARDEEMASRIARHRLQRPAVWQTFEAPVDPSTVIAAQADRFAVLLLDCLTVLITNRMLARKIDWDNPAMDDLNAAEEHILGEIEAILRAAGTGLADLVVVSNEVGCGIVPLSPLARFFRDCAGRVNQRMAAAADDVYYIVAGLPLRLKGG